MLGSGDEGDQAGRAADRPGPLGEPGGQAGDVQPRRHEQVLEAGLGQAAVAGVPQVAAADPLRDGVLLSWLLSSSAPFLGTQGAIWQQERRGRGR